MDGECSIVHQKTRPGKLSCQETWWFCKNSVISRIEVLNIHVQFRPCFWPTLCPVFMIPPAATNVLSDSLSFTLLYCSVWLGIDSGLITVARTSCLSHGLVQ